MDGVVGYCDSATKLVGCFIFELNTFGVASDTVFDTDHVRSFFFVYDVIKRFQRVFEVTS